MGLSVLKPDRLAIWSSILILLILTIWGLTGNCPLRPDGDEWFYVMPALKMAQSNTLNPLWLSHPASTTIYPLLFYFHSLNAVCFHGTLFTYDHDLYNVMYDHIFLLCFLPRFLDVLALAGCIPLIYGIAKYVFSRTAAVCACFIFAITPLLISLAQIVRSDCPAIFFSLLAIYAMLKLLENPSPRNQTFVGIAIGLALSSRYNTLPLVPLLLAINAKIVIGERKKGSTEIRQAVLLGIMGLAIAFITFACTTPFLFLDFATFKANMAAERADLGLGRDGLSPPQNLVYYLTHGIENITDRNVPFLAIIGFALAFFSSKRFEACLLAAFGLMVLFGTSLHPSHDDRWMIPNIPILVLFASNAIARFAFFIDRCAQKFFRPKIALAISAATVVVFLALIKAEAFYLACILNTQKMYFGTEPLFYKWVQDHIPAGTAICSVGPWNGPHEERYNVRTVLSCPTFFESYNHGSYISPAEVAKSGYGYFICSDAAYPSYFKEPERYALHCRFFNELWANSKVVIQFTPQKIATDSWFETRQYGPTYTLYKWGANR